MLFGCELNLNEEEALIIGIVESFLEQNCRFSLFKFQKNLKIFFLKNDNFFDFSEILEKFINRTNRNFHLFFVNSNQDYFGLSVQV